jgi:hypothetical protein
MTAWDRERNQPPRAAAMCFAVSGKWRNEVTLPANIIVTGWSGDEGIGATSQGEAGL